jgi:hypothetical protein
MGVMVQDAVMDAALDEVATATRLDVTSDSSTPTDLSNTLANVTLTAGDGNGDYVIADGDSSGRKITVAQQADVSITGSGTAKHIVLSLAGTIKLVTTCTDQVLTSGGTVTVPAFSYTLPDPSAV